MKGCPLPGQPWASDAATDDWSRGVKWDFFRFSFASLDLPPDTALSAVRQVLCSSSNN